MQQQMDDNELVITALARINDRIVATDFLQDWQSAMHSANRSVISHSQIGTRFRQLFSEAFTPVGTTVLLVAIFSLVIATILLNYTETQKESVLQPVESQAVSVSLDPNKPWYGPTDDLLQVAVLRYEKQWPTYVIYDPLTMEIK